MLKSSGSMAAATMTSRVLGMVREMVYAAFMGNTWVASAFTLAFQVPNLFRRLLGEGALTASFIPIFKNKEVAEGAGLICLVVVIGITIALKLPILDPSTADRGTILMLKLLRLMFPYMVLVC